MILIVLLLFLQAYCDLALPDLTSDLLNIGLQQNGIEHAAPETIREESLKTLEIFVPEAEIADLEAAYSEADSGGIRSLQADADIEKISGILALPESAVFQMENSGASGSIAAFRAGLATGLLTKEKILDGIREKLDAYGEMSASYLNQIAVSYTASEYKAQGVNLDEIRTRYLLKVGLRMILMTLLMSLAAVLTALLASRTSARIGMRLRESLYSKVMRFTNAEMEKFSTASLITRTTNDVQQVQYVIVMLLRMVAYAPVLGLFGILHVIETWSGMSWIIVMAVIILSALVGILVAIAMPKFRMMQKLVDRLNLVSREILTGVMLIRAFHRERHEEIRFEEASRDLMETQLFTNRAMTFMMPIMMLIMNGISVLIVWVGAGKVDLGSIQVGDLTAFITYSMVIVMSFLMLSMVSIILPRASVAADRIAEVLDTPISLKDPEMARDGEIAGGKGLLSFHDVSFSYPGADKNALEHLSFTAKPGEITAIVGSTGCGKSTLLNLIPRFFDVTEGSISLDGVDIREVSQKALRDRIGYVPQKGLLFSGTIESNIRYGGDSITEEEMKEAAAIAQAEEFINEKAEGYDFVISQEGSNVSGGQG